MSHYQSINNLSFQQSVEITKTLLKAFDFLKLLQFGYMPLHKNALLGSLLDGKMPLDDWTSPRGEHQTGNFIANKILDIIENIGPYLFATIVMDNGSNIYIARETNILIAFFQKSHLASRLLHDTISSMNIKGESLETYSETHW
ncbi:5612_t:CDS:2, partial [Gigaspora margarita]